MHKCTNCGTEFEGKFCPECGTKWEEAAGSIWGEIHSAPAEPWYEEPIEEGADESPTPLPPIAEKGSGNQMVAFPERHKEGSREGAEEEVVREGAEDGAYGKRDNVFAFFTETRLRKAYHALAIVPAAMCALFSFLLFMFCLAPYAEMLDVFTGGTTSIGNVYDMGGASSQTVVAFAAIGLALAGVALLFLFLPKLKWWEIPIRRIPVWGALSVLTFAVYFAPFVAACVICADVAKLDGGLGALKVGAGPILIIVFALFFLLALAGVGCTRYFISRKYPAFAAEEKDARTALAKQYKRPVPDEQTRLVMRLRTVMQWKIFLKWSIALLPFTFVATLAMLIIYMNGEFTFVDWKFFIVGLTFSLLTIGIGVGIWQTKKNLLPASDLQSVLVQSRHWFKRARVAFTIVGIFVCIVTAALIVWHFLYFRIYPRSSDKLFDDLSLTHHWIDWLGILFGLLAIAVAALEITFSNLGAHTLKIIEKTTEKPESVNLVQFNGVREERCAHGLRCGFPAAVLTGFLLVTILAFAGVGYSNFSVYKLKKIDFGDPYITVTRTLGNPDEGRETTSWSWYSGEYLSLVRQSDALQQQLETATSQKEIAELNEKIEQLLTKMHGVEYRCIVVTFTPDGFVTSVTLYQVKGDNRSVIYENPKPEIE